MKRPRGPRGEGRTGCILWLTFAGLVVYGLIKVVPVRVHIGQFTDAIQEQATFAASHSNAQIVNELVQKAQELDLPVTREQLTINRTREAIAIEAHYQVPVEFFGVWSWVMPVDRVVARPLVQL